MPSAPPTNITAAAISSTVIHVSWSSVPQLEQNGLIRGYKVNIVYSQRAGSGFKGTVIYVLNILTVRNWLSILPMD